MRVSSTDDRQSVDLQRNALIAAGIDSRHLYADKASGAREDRVNAEKLEQIMALAGGASKSSISRTFNVPRSTLTDTLNRAGRACQASRKNQNNEELANRSQ